ncbi:MAG: hypothetical protein WC711_02930, partial [Candidatus Staskawiczbacteria bacterium]
MNILRLFFYVVLAVAVVSTSTFFGYQYFQEFSQNINTDINKPAEFNINNLETNSQDNQNNKVNENSDIVNSNSGSANDGDKSVMYDNLGSIGNTNDVFGRTFISQEVVSRSWYLGGGGGVSYADTIISATAIAGVTPPVTGATPVTTVTAGTGYTGTVTWNGDPVT